MFRHFINRQSFVYGCHLLFDSNVIVLPDETVSQRPEKKKESATNTGKAKKKVPENKWTSKNDKQNYSHPWLLTSIKGHTGPILDIDFSSNGKYLASCADGKYFLIFFALTYISYGLKL